MRKVFLSGFRHPGIMAALASACLFGLGTPLAKWLLGRVDAWLLAALLYLGSGFGLAAYRLMRGVPWPGLARREWPWFVGAIALGGGAAPLLLMLGLAGTPASTAALLLNAEGVLTALIAWFVFRENFDRRVALGMAAIVLGALVLSWQGSWQAGSWVPVLCILGACLCWALDNNFTSKVSLVDAVWIASIKGLVAGSANLALALFIGSEWPGLATAGAAMLVGLVAYGASLALFVVGLRHLGTARTGAYFSLAPFVGALAALLLLQEPLTWALALAGALMAFGLWLHLTEHHAHAHTHAPMEHAHEHTHGPDDLGHHGHPHPPGAVLSGGHRHWHSHAPTVHTHAHFPDAHHTHEH